VFGTPPKAPKVKALDANSHVAISIDSRDWPYKVLLIRGTATVEVVDEGVIPEYEASALRYFGEEAGAGWVAQARSMSDQMVRVTVTPTWVCILDFESRFPSAIADQMSG